MEEHNRRKTDLTDVDVQAVADRRVKEIKAGRGLERVARNARAEAALGPMFNADKTRYVKREFLGWVCYEGTTTNGDVTGKRAGVVAEQLAAERWLNGQEVRWDIPADPTTGNLQTHRDRRKFERVADEAFPYPSDPRD
jgi:hypothetical protein